MKVYAAHQHQVLYDHDDDDAYVVGQGQHQAAEILLVGGVVAVAEPGYGLDTVDQPQDILAAMLLDVVVGDNSDAVQGLQHYSKEDVAVGIHHLGEGQRSGQCLPGYGQILEITRVDAVAVCVTHQRLQFLHFFGSQYSGGKLVELPCTLQGLLEFGVSQFYGCVRFIHSRQSEMLLQNYTNSVILQKCVRLNVSD